MHGQRHWLPYPAELPGSAAGGGAVSPSGLAALLALLDNNIQHVGPYSSAGGVSTPGTTIWLDSPVYTLFPSPVPGNATVDVKGSLSVSGTAGDEVTFELVRDRGTASAQVLATQESQIGTTPGDLLTATLAALDTNVGTFPAGFIPLTESSSHTYSIVATSAAALTGTQPASIILEQLPSGTTSTVPESPGAAPTMGSLLNFAAFAGAGISTTPGTTQTSIAGNIGLGPGVTSTAFTGFAPTLGAGANHATSALVHASLTQDQVAPYIPPSGLQPGWLYAADYAPPTPANVNTSYNDLLAAYTDASGRPASPANTDVAGGIITGATGPFVPGVYKWNTPVTATGMTLNGAGIYIFIIAGTFDLEAAAAMVLEGGALPGNVYFAIAGAVTLHAASIAQGEFLTATDLAMQNGATLTGRALPQTGLTLIGNTLTEA
jgi:hypothetical protein